MEIKFKKRDQCGSNLEDLANLASNLTKTWFRKFHKIQLQVNLYNPRKKSFLQFISIATQHVTSCGFLLQDTGLNAYPFISKSNCFNAAIAQLTKYPKTNNILQHMIAYIKSTGLLFLRTKDPLPSLGHNISKGRQKKITNKGKNPHKRE